MKSSPPQLSKRQLLSLATLWPWTAGCMADRGGAVHGAGVDSQRRFHGIGVVLVVDAVPGAELKGVVFYDDRPVRIYASSTVAKRNREILALGGARVPPTVRVIWRQDPKPIWGKDGGIDYDGMIIGDYTIPVAERIPAEVLDSIRSSGGALRLKFRLKPDGVLFGWDIERPGGGISKFDMPGGDFLETRY
jgi:hypothetical protein